MTDQTIPDVTDNDRRLAREWAEGIEANPKSWSLLTRTAARVVLDTVPTPPRPTLADMTLGEQDECAGMQADLAQGDRVVILDGTPDRDDSVQVLETNLGVFRPRPADVTPRPDLPRMEWPGTEKPAPAPALPDGWRLADHPDHGRIIVTNPDPDCDGEAAIIVPTPTNIDHARLEWCTPDELTYLDQEADQ